MNTERKPGYYRVKYLGNWRIAYTGNGMFFSIRPYPSSFEIEDFDEIIETPISPSPVDETESHTKEMCLAFMKWRGTQDRFWDEETQMWLTTWRDDSPKTDDELFSMFLEWIKEAK